MPYPKQLVRPHPEEVKPINVYLGFVADKILGQIVDWFYGQVVGFLGNFFAEMGNMGVELFEMSWVQSIVLFFSYLAWALYGTGLVVACFECGIEYSSGRGNIRETALNAIKGFMAVSLFTVVPIRSMSFPLHCRQASPRGSQGMAPPSARRQPRLWIHSAALIR